MLPALNPFALPVSRLSKNMTGLTLVELMLTLLMLSLLISFSVPSLTDFIANRRVSLATDTLYSSMMLARSEAVTRRMPVSLCNSTDGVNCSEQAGDWARGWLIFIDDDSDGDRDAGDRLIKVFEGHDGLGSLSWNLSTPPRYTRQGRARQGGRFTLCGEAMDGFAVREIILSLTGRARVTESVDC